MKIDLNSDLAEGFGAWRMGEDETLLDIVSSANLACGFHAGDPRTIRSAVTRAVDLGVRVGAQVSYRDLAGFGRRPDDLARCLESLVCQETARPFEIIVVDNVPASGLTPPVVARFPGVKLVAEARAGASYARNAGVLASRGAIVATTEASTARLAERAHEAGSTAVARCIYNGWDAHDLEAASQVAPAVPRDPARVRLVYTGTLWNLTSVAPVIAAIRQLASDAPTLLSRLELVVVGRKTPEQQALLAPLPSLGVALADVPYCDHSVAIATMQSADALLLLLSDVPGAERVAPAKVFEYLAVQRPMLAVMPDGEIATLVRDAQGGGHYLPSDVAGIAGWLRALLVNGPPAAPPESAGARFERRALAGQLATLLTTVTAGATR